MAQLELLFTREQIGERVGAMARDITGDFAPQPVLLVGVLRGAAVFLSDLARQLQLDVSFDFIGVSSYRQGTESTGEVRLTKDLDQSIAGANVVLVEDILDTGLTVAYLKRLLSARRPRCLRLAALLDKPARRVEPITADYVGFAIPDRFVVGYGMDYAERYRNLPDIFVLELEPDRDTSG